MAQTSCQLASGYPGRGVTFPGCHTTVTTHWTHRHPPPSPLGISTASCGCLPMARSNEGIPKPPVCTDDRGQEQGHREIAFQRLEPCSSSPAVGSRITMHPSFVPGCGGRYVCWPTRAAGSRQAPAPLLPTHGASIIAFFLRMAFAVIERLGTQHAVLCIFPDVIIMLKHTITARLRRRVSSPVHSTVIYSPDVCLTLFDAMQMSSDRGLKTAPTTSWDRWDNFGAVFCTKVRPKTLLSVPKVKLSENESTLNSNRLCQAAQDASLSLPPNALRSSPLLAILTCQAR